MIKRRSGMIPRKTLQARRVIETRNSFNEITGVQYVTFQALQCTDQPYEGDTFDPNMTGFTNRKVRTVFTETLLQDGDDNSNRKADEVFMYGSWWKVFKVKSWQVGLIPHYEVIVIEKDEGLL